MSFFRRRPDKKKTKIDNFLNNLKEPPVIIAHTSGDDYEVLNKINRNIKQAAVNELAATTDLSVKAGISPLTPGNKYWILQAMGFKAIDKNTWKHPFIDQPVLFDIIQDDLPRFASRLFKLGYHQSLNEVRLNIEKSFGLK